MLIPRIKQIRKKLGMTQAKLSDYLTKSKKLYISRETIAKYESGIIYPSSEMIDKLASALNVSSYYLAGKGMQESEIDNSLTDLLHNTYFYNYQRTYPKYLEILNILQSFIQNHLNFLVQTSGYLSPTEIDTLNPHTFYRDALPKNSPSNLIGDVNKKAIENHFPRFKYVDEFWIEKFNFLYIDTDFREELIGSTNEEFIVLVTKRIEKQYNLESERRNTEVLIEFVDKFSENTNHDVAKWQSGSISKKEVIKNLDIRLKHLTNFIQHSDFGNEDKSE